MISTYFKLTRDRKELKTEERKIKIGVHLLLSSFESLSKLMSSLYMRDLQ